MNEALHQTDLKERSTYRPERAPSPAPRPAARWGPAPRTPPSSPWGSWCLWSTPWTGTTRHSRSFSLWGARAAWHSDSTEPCRERRVTEGDRSVNGAPEHLRHRERPTAPCAPASRAGGSRVTASARLTWCTNVCVTFRRVCSARRSLRVVRAGMEVV